MTFFDTTPIGRILNRFAKDISAIDVMLPKAIPTFVYALATLAGVIVVIIIVLPWFAVAVVPLLFLYYKIQKYYRPVSRDLQRLDCLSCSPIFAHFSETLNGVATLRAFNKQQQCMQENIARIDDSNRAYYMVQLYRPRCSRCRAYAMKSHCTNTYDH
eukprot:20644-Heterococcus_DN1.PRE.3